MVHITQKIKMNDRNEIEWKRKRTLKDLKGKTSDLICEILNYKECTKIRFKVQENLYEKLQLVVRKDEFLFVKTTNLYNTNFTNYKWLDSCDFLTD